jgi:hypothetical protein
MPMVDAEKVFMQLQPEQIRAHRLRAHHLDRKLPACDIIKAAEVCGLQNSPPGAWETSLFNRLETCTLTTLHNALYTEKTLLQAWSFRGAPFVFPTEQSDIFLTPLIAQEGEDPWIYTAGVKGALDHLQMPFEEVLARVKTAIAYLDEHAITSKEALDRTLANIVFQDLPAEKQALWQDPSIYGNPQKQTMGDAAVSFLLRPCSFYSLIVFGKREGTSPTFTSFRHWVGRNSTHIPNADKELVRKFVHCYGPATKNDLMSWLGCSRKQAQRLWGTVSNELVPIEVESKTGFMSASDLDNLPQEVCDQDQLLLLGAHDPYLDLRDRGMILRDKAQHKEVWKYVSNPGVILKGGRIIGTWRTASTAKTLAFSLITWEKLSKNEHQKLNELAEDYASFRGKHPRVAFSG